MCLQIKLYATIEPYIYIIILPIAREEVGGLVPKIMFEFCCSILEHVGLFWQRYLSEQPAFDMIC